MAFIRPALATEPQPVLRGEGVVLRPPMAVDFDAWRRLRDVSRASLTPWEPEWTPDELSRASFRTRLKRYQQDARLDLGYAFFVLRSDDLSLMGAMSLSLVRRGVSQAAFVGYWIGDEFTRRGHASAALRRLIRFAFVELELHRLEAACMPTNRASLRVLEKTGFAREGCARKYLKINGVWEDHIMLGLLSEDRM